VQGGVVQLLLAVGLLYAFWSGALAAVIEGLTAAIRGQEPGIRLFDAATAGRTSRPPAIVGASATPGTGYIGGLTGGAQAAAAAQAAGFPG
jgi:hypothetical protein